MKPKELLDLIKSRRSIRKFDQNKDIPDNIINDILESGIWAPTGTNQQELRFILLKDKKLIQKFGEFKKIKSQNLVILIFINYEKYYSDFSIKIRNLKHKKNLPFIDTGLAMMNMMLMAEIHGIKSVPLNVSDFLFADNKKNNRSFFERLQRKIAKSLHKSWFGIKYYPDFCKEIGVNPKKMIPSGALALGYSDKIIDVETYKHGKKPIKRKNIEEHILSVL